MFLEVIVRSFLMITGIICFFKGLSCIVSRRGDYDYIVWALIGVWLFLMGCLFDWSILAEMI